MTHVTEYLNGNLNIVPLCRKMQYGPSSGISFRRDALCGFYAKCQVVELTAKAASYNQLSLQALLCLFKCYGSLQTKWESQALLTAVPVRHSCTHNTVLVC